jgi:uncharacterized glyoxalase superfamily metalloenzyme YdcJ
MFSSDKKTIASSQDHDCPSQVNCLMTKEESMDAKFADQRQMQHRLFSNLSDMFGEEVPLYDKSLVINSVCNRTVCDLLGQLHVGFDMTAEQIAKTSGERHGAIRIGKPSEYRWISRLFAVFAMEPHNFYDMTAVGDKSQPIIATAFRSRINPDHRVFSSLLMTDYFDPDTKARIESLIATREVFSEKAKELIVKNERQGGLKWNDAETLIDQCVHHIFKWTGEARDYQLYTDLCEAGFKIAADIACFGSHHLNHLTPNTFCIDLYTTAMKFCMGEREEARFRAQAMTTLNSLTETADRDYLQLHFKDLTSAEIDSFQTESVTTKKVKDLVDKLTERLQQTDLNLSALKHAGFKDHTEGPASGTPILLRQDAYKALSEPVQFHNEDGTTVDSIHTARFGEIEQRFYATTPKGRKLYDRCLAEVDSIRKNSDSSLYEKMHAQLFETFPKKLIELLKQELVYGRYSVTKKGLAAKGDITTTDIHELFQLDYVSVEGLRYEDFLPVSAAGIFASNLSQYGTQSTAVEKPIYSQDILENILGRKIVNADETYAGIQAESLLNVYTLLGLESHLTENNSL